MLQKFTGFELFILGRKGLVMVVFRSLVLLYVSAVRSGLGMQFRLEIVLKMLVVT